MRPLRLAIRADASQELGSGHVMRCLTLADRLRARGAEITFLCAPLPGNLIGYLESHGFPVLPVGGGAGRGDAAGEAGLVAPLLAGLAPLDWLVVDHYALDIAFERALRPLVGGIMVIDDLADRRHDCRILLDQNLHPQLAARYDSLVPRQCRKLLGPRYALLRPEFARARRGLRLRDGSVRRLLVFFGGSDPAGATLKALEAIAGLGNPELAVDVVVGGSNPQGDRVREICRGVPAFSYHCQVGNMAQLMARADLAVGAGGSATWERCFLGLPALTLVIAENQREIAAAVAKAGAARDLGWCSAVSVQALREALADLLRSPDLLRQMQDRALALMAGAGAAAEEELMNALTENPRV